MIKKRFLRQTLSLFVLMLFASNVWAYAVLDTGDPDERVCNPKSYTDLGDGTVRDEKTGLEWKQQTNSTRYTWFQADNYCNSLTFPSGGYTDWRLPTAQELATIIDLGRGDPAIDPVFDMAMETRYWSADSRVDNSAYAWLVNFGSGWIRSDTDVKTTTLSVRPVRGPYYGPVSAFVANGDGTVSDPDTGLIWQQDGSALENWDDAVACIEDLNADVYLGYDDWRLPTRNELQSLLDYGYANPATSFPNIGSVGYWSSTTLSGDTDLAWEVHFQYGDAYARNKASNYYVRAVRGGACSAECLTDDHCDDGVACNGEETCENQFCEPGQTPCEENEYCDEEDDACVECLIDDHCSNTIFCDGAEVCAGGVCHEGTDPCGSSTPVCDEAGERCVECLSDDHCDDGVACNGVETCVSEICAAGTTTCGAQEYCEESKDECVECLNNTHCDDGVFCNGAETCTAHACFDGTEPCTGDDYCDESIDACVECYNDAHCPDDSLWCTGSPICEGYVCGFEETCPGEQCNETSQQCVECLTDAHCDDDLFCTGVETCIHDVCFDGPEPCDGVDEQCDESKDVCVECLLDEHCAQGYECFGNTCVPGGLLWISKASVKAGKTDGADSIQLQGILDVAEDDLFAARGDAIIVSLASEYIPGAGTITWEFPLDAEYLSKGKYASPKIKPADKTDPVTSLAIDTNKGIMKFSAKNVDLTGLGCPITCRVTIGDDVYIAEMVMGEGLVNRTKPCPLPLLMGAHDSLDAAKVKAKKSTKTAADSISITGTFTIDGECDMNEPVVIMIGDDAFTVEAAAFSEKKGAYSCKKFDSNHGFVTAKFDTVKCSYSIKIKNTALSGSGNVVFKLDIFGNILVASSQISLPLEP